MFGLVDVFQQCVDKCVKKKKGFKAEKQCIKNQCRDEVSATCLIGFENYISFSPLKPLVSHLHVLSSLHHFFQCKDGAETCSGYKRSEWKDFVGDKCDFLY